MTPERFGKAGVLGSLHLKDAEANILVGLSPHQAYNSLPVCLQLTPCVPPFPQLDSDECGLDQSV